MGDLVDEYRRIFRDSLLKVLSAKDVGEKRVIDDEIKLFGVPCLILPFLPFFVIFIDALSQFLQRCLPPCLELLSIEEPVLLDAHPRIEHVRIAASLQIFSNFAQSPFELFVKPREVNW
jgi:hypothetical protein